mgnify:CR=1 FL=1
MKGVGMIARIAGIVLPSLLLISIACATDSTGRDGGAFPLPEPETSEAGFAERFYRPVEWSTDAAMPSYALPVRPEEVINLREALRLVGAEEPDPRLLSNGFAIYPSPHPTDDPVDAFSMLEGAGQPVYVSAGIPLHMLHVFFDQLLQQVEQRYILPDLIEICSALYSRSLEREDRMTAAYFGVALQLLEPDFEPHPLIAESVADEVEMIRAREGFSESALFEYREDYSQYVPRGHYTASDSLRRYFMGMMWLGRMTFLLNGGEPHGPAATYLVPREVAMAQTAAGVRISSMLATMETGGETLMLKWRRIYEVTAFFAGFSDDLSATEYLQAARTVAGPEATGAELQEDPFYEAFRSEVLERFGGPRIYSGTGEAVIMPDSTGGFSPRQMVEVLGKTAGFRFMGQRYAFDSRILAAVVFPAAGENAEGEQRFMPSGLDVANAFGVARAAQIQRAHGVYEFAHYADSMEALRESIDSMTPGMWHRTLYNTWLHALKLYVRPRGEGYPAWMRTPAWQTHVMSNFLASWAMLRHDTILYVKQTYTPTCGAAPPGPEPSAGFVEPVPGVYAEVRAALQMARRGLEDYGMMDQSMSRQLESADGMMRRLQSIAERELVGQPLEESDNIFLKSFAERLETVIAPGMETRKGTETSMIADVHTDQNLGSVQEVGSGNLDRMLLIRVRPDGHLEAVVGPVLSYWEFTWPMGDRLTDEAWRELLGSGDLPRPDWMGRILVPR